MSAKTNQMKPEAKVTTIPWSMVCLPTPQGRIDAQWLAQIESLRPVRTYTTHALAPIHDLTPLPAGLLRDPYWLLQLSQLIETPVLVLRSGLALPPYLLERMVAIQALATVAPVVVLPGNYCGHFNPFNGFREPSSIESADALMWNTSEAKLAPIEPGLAGQIQAAWVWPAKATQEPADVNQAFAITDVCFVSDPNQSVKTQTPLSPLVSAAFGTKRRDREQLVDAGYTGLGYPGLDGRPVTLHISHDWGGGIARWIDDLHRHDLGHHHLVLASKAPSDALQYGHELVLYADGPGHAVTQRYSLDPVIADTVISHPSYRDFLDWLVGRFGVGRIVVSSLIGHSLDALTSQVPTAQVLHDFYPASPVLDTDPMNYANADGSLNLQALINEHLPTFKFIHQSPIHWEALRDEWSRSIKSGHVTLIAPSAHVADRWQRLFPEHTLPKINIIAHGFDHPVSWMGQTPLKSRPFDGSGLLHLVSIGRLSRGKGLNRLIKAASALGARVRFTVIGGGQDAIRLFGMPNIDVILDYSLNDLPQAIAKIKPHAAIFLSRVPETWNYVLSEVRCLGLPVIAPNLGSFSERIDDRVDGLLYSPSADGLIDLLEALLSGELTWPTDPPPVAEPSMTLAIKGYASVLPSAKPSLLLRKHPPHAVRALGEALHALNAAAHQCSDLAEETRQLHNRLIEQARWLDRLDRTVKERTEWALNIDRALRDRDYELEQQHQANQILRREISLFDEKGRYLEALKKQIVVIEAERDEARQAHLDVHRQLTQLQDQYQRLDEQLAMILRSRSWRLTRPLRATARILTALHQRKAWHPMNWSRQFKRFIHAIRVHGWRTTFEALQHYRPTDGQEQRHIISVDPPCQDGTLSPIHFDFERTEGPLEVSIIIPVYNELNYTANCLSSILEHHGHDGLEIIVVDDGSNDGTAEYLAQCTGIHVVTNPKNLGFIGSCNAGAEQAKGDFLVFLNNDTQVTAGWLDALLRPFNRETTGIVGARLVYPNGQLQEAGGIIFNDGSGWNYGRLGSAYASRVQFLSETDYVSGACLAIRRAIFNRLGGFDAHYSPAYYEDTDLCFKVRALGLKIIYQPAATVIHFEGVSSGTSEHSGTKRYQAINREKFKTRWADTLASHPAPVPGPQAIQLIERARHHRARGFVLVVDAVTPQPDQDSGSVRMLAILELLVELGYRVSFMPINLAWDGQYSEALQDRGIEVIRHPETSSPKAWLESYGGLLNWVIGSRYYVLEGLMPHIEKYCPDAKTIFDTVDLHFLREQRKAELENDATLAEIAKTTRKKELALIEKADITLVVSNVEKTLLNELMPQSDIRVLSNIHTVQTHVEPAASRRGLLFVGGFQHPPNIDAAKWLIDEILPALLDIEPSIELHLIGSKMPDWLRSMRAPGLINHGYVKDIDPYLQKSKIALAPLRYGAGVKGKVNQAMAYGLPVVATTCAAEGMHVEDGHDILIADDTAAFIDQIIRLYRDDDLWQKLSRHGQDNVAQYFSRYASKQALNDILSPSSGEQDPVETT